LKRTLAAFLTPLLLIGCNLDEFPEFNPRPIIDYQQEMRDFVRGISRYAKGIEADFIIVPQGGIEIVSTNGRVSGSADTAYINAIDGLEQESVFYGQGGIDQPTPAAERNRLRTFLDLAKDNGDVTILVTDFAFTPSKVDDSYDLNAEAGYISFAADHEALDNIPEYPPQPHNENNRNILRLDQAENFLNLINPRSFSSRQALVDAVSDTNYDLVIIDFFFNGEAYTEEQIEQLQQKRDGGRRLLLAYVSIGQAEDDRFYWQNSWFSNPPVWLGEVVSGTSGNYIVDYWEEGWQDIIFGNDDSYLFRVIDAGFDGAYLDYVDAFEFFEE